jgi:hypothetical protein
MKGRVAGEHGPAPPALARRNRVVTLDGRNRVPSHARGQRGANRPWLSLVLNVLNVRNIPNAAIATMTIPTMSIAGAPSCNRVRDPPRGPGPRAINVHWFCKTSNCIPVLSYDRRR